MMSYPNDDSLISIVQVTHAYGFYWQIDGDETFLESSRSYVFELTTNTSGAAGEGETQVHPMMELMYPNGCLYYLKKLRQQYRWLKNFKWPRVQDELLQN